MKIASLSGGKDSTAMVLRLCELRTPPDKLVFFDGGWDWPEIYHHIEMLAEFTKIPLIRCYPQRGSYRVDFDFLSQKYVKVKGKSKGEVGYGWPDSGRRWCTREKCDAIERALSQLDEEIEVVYVGIADDETDSRGTPEYNRYGTRCEYPLVDWGWDEARALEYCYEQGYLFDGLYEHFSRVSCWCCPLQTIKELRTLWKHFPDMWQRLERTQHCINNRNKDGSEPSSGCRFKRNKRGYANTVDGWNLRFIDEDPSHGKFNGQLLLPGMGNEEQ